MDSDSDDLPPPPRPVRKKVVRRLEEFEPDEIEVLKSIELSESGETEEEFHEHADMTMWSDFLVWYYYDDYLEKWLENDSPQEYTPYGYLPTYDGAEWALKRFMNWPLTITPTIAQTLFSASCVSPAPV